MSQVVLGTSTGEDPSYALERLSGFFCGNEELLAFRRQINILANTEEDNITIILKESALKPVKPSEKRYDFCWVREAGTTVYVTPVDPRRVSVEQAHDVRWASFHLGPRNDTEDWDHRPYFILYLIDGNSYSSLQSQTLSPS